MPAAVAGAAISGAAGIGGAILGNKAQKKATDVNLQAQREALAYEREREAKAEADYKMRMDLWQQNRAALARRYGINVPNAPMSAGQPTGGAPPRVTLGSIMNRGVAPPVMKGAPEAPADPYAWNEWSQYAPARR